VNELILLSFSHIFIVLICITSIIFIPKFFKYSSSATHSSLAYFIISLILVNQGMDLYREGYLDEWKLGLPLHLCDFSSFSILIYLLTKKRDFFIFAFFFGIAGAGMSILTPDTEYGFPAVGYIQNQIGHTAIILGVTYAMVIDNQRPYLKDVARALGFATFLLFIMYGVNYLLGPPANYWFIVEKPIGENVTLFMRPAPFHMIDLWLLAVAVCYLIYLPYYLKDRKIK
jgi:hypothetical integral membrane protein (TIGR02206 family)